MKLIFCMEINITVSHKLMIWFWWAWSGILKVLKVTGLQYLYNIPKKKSGREFMFLHASKHQSFWKFTLSFSMKVIRHVQSTQNKNNIFFRIFYQKKSVATDFLFYCDPKHSDVLRGSSYVCCCLFSHVYLRMCLTHLSPMFNFCTPWKRQKTKVFLTFSGGLEMEHWSQMG